MPDCRSSQGPTSSVQSSGTQACPSRSAAGCPQGNRAASQAWQMGPLCMLAQPCRRSSSARCAASGGNAWPCAAAWKMGANSWCTYSGTCLAARSLQMEAAQQGWAVSLGGGAAATLPCHA